MCNKRKYRDKISAMFALSQCRRYTKVTEKLESRYYYCRNSYPYRQYSILFNICRNCFI